MAKPDDKKGITTINPDFTVQNLDGLMQEDNYICTLKPMDCHDTNFVNTLTLKSLMGPGSCHNDNF